VPRCRPGSNTDEVSSCEWECDRHATDALSPSASDARSNPPSDGDERGRRRLEAANPSVRALERATERDLTSDEMATVKAWLVATAQRLERAIESRAA
jgi:hypothetical protein